MPLIAFLLVAVGSGNHLAQIFLLLFLLQGLELQNTSACRTLLEKKGSGRLLLICDLARSTSFPRNCCFICVIAFLQLLNGFKKEFE